MSLQSSTINLTKSELPDTYYFHRTYHLDLPNDHSWKQECPWLFLARRIAVMGLPLLSLCKPLHTPLALTLGAMRVYNFGNGFNNSRGEEECLLYGINAGLATCALAATFFNRSAGALITTGQDILIMLYFFITVWRGQPIRICCTPSCGLPAMLFISHSCFQEERSLL